MCQSCHFQTNGFASSCRACGAPCVEAGAALTLEPGRFLQHGRFEVRGLIGAGEFGVTYKVLRKATLEIVAIKEHVPADLLERNPNGQFFPRRGQEHALARSFERFEREGRLLQNLCHPSIVRCLEHFYEFGTAYLVLEFLEGEPLSARIARGQRLKAAEALRLLGQLLGALEVIHASGALHRDIKPANIVLTAGRAVLVDFGAVGPLHGPVSTRVLTPAYAALEQYGRGIELGPQIDLFALAATTIEAIMGVAPTSVLERANGVPLGPIFAPELPERVVRVLEAALSLRIADRPRSAFEMRERLGIARDERVWGPVPRAV